MTEVGSFLISVINLLSLFLGILAIMLIFKISRKYFSAFVSPLLFFLICAVIAGFCDWIVLNWVMALVSGLSENEADLIFHVFWDLIGFPASLCALYFLIRMLYAILGRRITQMLNRVLILFVVVLTALSYVGFYFRIQESEHLIRTSIWMTSVHGIPFLRIAFLAMAYYQWTKMDKKNPLFGNFILILMLSFLVWHLLSLMTMISGYWHHLIILGYYLALFLPTFYLYRHKTLLPGTEKSAAGIPKEELFRQFHITEREQVLIRLLMAGKSNQEIAEEMFISLQTTKNYLSKIFAKTGVKNRVQLVNLFRRA